MKSAVREGDAWTVSVTLKHDDVDGEHYADRWRVVTRRGLILGTCEVEQPHRDQPFVCSLKGVAIPSRIKAVYIEAHDKAHDWAKERFKVKLDHLKIGDAAPDIRAVDQEGNLWRLEDHLGRKYVVLYFYPAAMTGGCTKQACSYRDFNNRETASELEIVGISGDSPESLRIFQRAHQLNFTLLSDPDGIIANCYEVPVTKGQKSLKFALDGDEVTLERSRTAARWTFIINPQGRIIYRDMNVKATEDLDNVLGFIRKTKDGL